MKYKLAKVTVYKNEGKLTILIAPEDVHPTKYTTVEYKKGNSLSDSLRMLCTGVLEGSYLPTEGCKTFRPEILYPVNIKIDDIFEKKPWLKSMVHSSYPKDLDNLTDDFHKRFYRIMGDYLATFAFPKQFPFHKEDMDKYVSERLEALSKEAYVFVVEKDIRQLRKENVNTRLINLQNRYHLPDTESVVQRAADYLLFRIERETNPDLKKYFIQKLDEFAEITVDNINDFERFCNHYPIPFVMEEKLQNKSEEMVYDENYK